MEKIQQYQKFRDVYRHYRLINLNKFDKGFKCNICGNMIKSVSGLGSHVLYKHGLLLENYILKTFKNNTPNFKYEKCGFCNNNAQPEMSVNYKENIYSLSYDHGYICNTEQCLDNICKEFFGTSYKESKQKYEHIGANVNFLTRKYQKSEEEICRTMKANPNFVMPISGRTNLEGYILRYGKEEGTKRYTERCQKISKSTTIEWYIEKYGIDEGTQRFQTMRNRMFNASRDITYSKVQYQISEALKKIDLNWKDERYCGGFAQVDISNEQLGVAIEYYGNYWHCNPENYSADFYNKSLKCTAQEKWNLDNIRLNKILTRSKTISLIIVIWEKVFYKINDLDTIINMIYDCINEHNNSEKQIVYL